MKHSIVIYIYIWLCLKIEYPLILRLIYLKIFVHLCFVSIFQNARWEIPPESATGHASTRDSSSTKGNARRVTGPASV